MQLIAILFATSCTKNSLTKLNSSTADNSFATAATTAGPYTNVFIGQVNNGNGTWTYTWSMQNTAPSKTHQDLSHWDMLLGTCVTMDNVVGAAMVLVFRCYWFGFVWLARYRASGRLRFVGSGPDPQLCSTPLRPLPNDFY